MTAFPKSTYIRSKALLRAIATLPCMHCGSEGMTQAAHSNRASHGKGRSLKASDEYSCALCFTCHQSMDQGSRLSRDERETMHSNAWRKTVRELVKRGLWPAAVPIPDIRVMN